MPSPFLELVKKRVVLLDGGFGTELIRHGFPQGACPESWNVEKPEAVKNIHRSYFEAGSDAVLTNSFGGSAIKLAAHGLDGRCYELNRAAALLANEVKPRGKFVGGSLGPTGKFLKPHGDYTEEEFEAAYAEQARGLTDGRADFLLIETQYDLREALCAYRAAARVSSLPVFVTMTFNHTPRGFFTLMGNSAADCVRELEKNSAPVVGANCTVNSQEMVDLVKVMRTATSLPLIAQANAGKPSLSVEGKVSYSQGLEDYIRFVPQIIESGAKIVGGCCGTNPDYIREMARLLQKA